MDFDTLKNQVANISLYDLKAGFRKAQNAVMNYTEMEAKVREATNNEPWGCPTSVMQDIANGTFNYTTLTEIMPMIYKRFTEKSAEEWRQIYKALQLLEFLIKNGSERVIDDARTHLSLLKMLRQFHYIDQNGKDQGINVRNRAKELGELLGDVERIRAERKKARQTRGKYAGVEGGAGLGGSSSGRYSGYGNESSGAYGGYSGGVYGDGGGFGGNAAEDEYQTTQGRHDKFEEYDEYNEAGSSTAPSRRRTEAPAASRASKPASAPKPKESEVDLFDFSEDPIPAPSNGGKQAASDDFGGFTSATPADDDFDDFVSATPSSAIPPPAAASSYNQFAIPKPTPASTSQSNNNLFSSSISPPPSSSSATPSVNYSAFKATAPAQAPIQPAVSNFQQTTSPRPTNYQATQPNYFGSIAAAAPTTAGQAAKTAKPKASSGDPFADLALGIGKKSNAPTRGPAMADLAREKSSAGIWGPSAGQSRNGSSNGGGSDLLGI